MVNGLALKALASADFTSLIPKKFDLDIFANSLEEKRKNIFKEVLYNE